ncbi:NADPH:quinone reductase [Halobacteriovorax marinus]|uniref:NADPH:quinone reductase n=1 Tax=Halobacteriovorax marinus TaxID=97084 RepID=A0A1Y5F822_9BACT|nr:NADPH:quinone reductase [Halobacteriovorax marinus]
MKKILVINGHPSPDQSFCRSIYDTYLQGLEKTNFEVKSIDMGAIEFDSNLKYGYSKRVELEPCLMEAQEKIIWSNHIVIIHPVWWGSLPAKFKGFFDRTFLPGFAFEKREDSVWWDKLLVGKSAHIISTLDQPGYYYRLRYGRPSHRALKDMTLNFSGISPVRSTVIGPVRNSTENFKEKQLDKILKLSLKGR